MNFFSHLNNLAARVRQGEREAAEQLYELLAPQMIRFVRRTLRHGTGSSPLDQRILAEARRALADNSDQRPPEGESLVQQVAQQLCDNLLRRVPQAGAPTRCLVDTIVT
jgi:hypothetical protein